ncbi:MAG: UDP-N-acetylmuramoylalanyl-D-glutamyl-2,6-diaminopimelate--D-alanyl-D-alanine ligase, partial [Rhodospirillales bacterium]|nr:UDP-N-acetylmuramoylalanyl-D-glutamyl-2,6-diaminopimelate--D-alanyl-D-alanine ligase [Rhodospirillales bacterium]
MAKAILWTSDQAVSATGGACSKAWSATGVSIDSRAVEEGDLFVAIRGPNMDGHDFVADALARGAVAAVVDHVPAGIAKDAALLVVDDTDKALRMLGAQARARTSAKIVGVTGSVGKTGMKEALLAILSAQGATTATKGNLNNHWGLPLSLARMPEDTRYGVFEMGMNHPGELTTLSELARPHVAIITTVEKVHAQFFSSVEDIADAKAEIFAGMDSEGAAVLNRDNPHFDRLADAARAHGVTRIIGFGLSADAQCRAVSFEMDAEGADVVADIDGQRVTYRIGIPGRHWVGNSLGALAVVHALGCDVAAAAAALAKLRPLKGRGEKHSVTIPGGTFQLIDESYNASPVSMRAAIETLAACPVGNRGRRIAVLGDMLELGRETPELHAGLVNVLEEAGVDVVFTAGRAMAHLRDALTASMRGGYQPDSKHLASLVVAGIRPGDVVMVKGSAGS